MAEEAKTKQAAAAPKAKAAPRKAAKKKATPYAAGVIVRTVAEKVAPTGLKDLLVFVCGVGQGRDAAVRALNANGFNVLSIKDITMLPHNGCRPPRLRRV